MLKAVIPQWPDILRDISWLCQMVWCPDQRYGNYTLASTTEVHLQTCILYVSGVLKTPVFLLAKIKAFEMRPMTDKYPVHPIWGSVN